MTHRGAAIGFEEAAHTTLRAICVGVACVASVGLGVATSAVRRRGVRNRVAIASALGPRHDRKGQQRGSRRKCMNTQAMGFHLSVSSDRAKLRERSATVREVASNGPNRNRVGSVRREGLDHLIVLSEMHLQHVLAEYALSYF